MAKRNKEIQYEKIMKAELQRILTGRLNQLCQEQHLTLQQLAVKSGVSIFTLRKLSQGKHCNINSKTMLKLSRAFCITPSQLFDENLLISDNKE